MKGLIMNGWQIAIIQPAFICSKSTIETLEQGVKYVHSYPSVSIVNFEHIIANWKKCTLTGGELSVKWLLRPT